MAERLSERWWTWAQAVHFVLANFPCENLQNADGHLRCHIAGDTFPVRWWTYSDNVVVPVAGLGRDWVMDRDLGRDPCDRYGVGGELVLEGAAVRRFCGQRVPGARSTAPSRRPRQVKRESAAQILAKMYPDGTIPERATIDNKPLFHTMQIAGFEGSYSTAMRAAGRRR
jgi:hypothetical protein